MRYPKKKNSLQKEKIAFLTIAAFVLTVLTMTGIMVREKNKGTDEYQVDLAKLNENSGFKSESGSDSVLLDEDFLNDVNALSNDMDVDPNFWEVDSGEVIAKLSNDLGAKTENVVAAQEEKPSVEEKKEVVTAAEEQTQNGGAENQTGGNSEETLETSTATVVQYSFISDRVLNVPVAGVVLIPYSMDKPVYFKTLNQYKYNDAVVVSAVVGENVASPASGVIKRVGKNAEIGNYVQIEIGDGYELTLAQLKDIGVKEGDIIAKGDVIGRVAEPSSFYTIEGCNIYMKLTHNETVLDPTAEI